MKKKIIIIFLIGGLFTMLYSCKKQRAYSALIVTGQNNHNWQVSSRVLKQLLDETTLFTTEIIATPAQGKDMNIFNPDFEKYDVVIIDYMGDSWSATTRNNFVEYVKNGGGVIIYHEADNAFPEWKEYNEIIGLGGWGNRNEKNGPYIYMKNNQLIVDTTKGAAGDISNQHTYTVKIRNEEHPITKGLPQTWLHGKDQLYSRLRGPAKNMEILATAFSDTAHRGTNRDEPVLFTISYGNGRIFHTVLGHADKNSKCFTALNCIGFKTTFQRGAEWAASGVVTQRIPQEFSNPNAVQAQNNTQLSLDELMAKVENYDMAKSRRYFYDLQNRIRTSDGKPETLLAFEKLVVKTIQKDGVTNEAKKLLIRELSWMGSEYSVPVLQELKKTTDLMDDAQFALTRLESK